MRPQLSNSKIRLLEPISMTDHVKASCWLNIEDAELKERFEAYLRTAGEKGRPNVQLERVDGGGQYRKIGSFQLFLNEPREGGGGGSGSGGFDL